MKPKRLSEAEIQIAVTRAVEDARAYITSEVTPDRIRAADYFDGKVNLDAEEGRSRVVATKVRDTIRAVLPALMRVFLQSGKPVEFTPRSPDGAEMAEQQTAYAQYIFEREGGFQALYDVFFDALLKKAGILKVWFEEDADEDFDEYSGISDEVYTFLQTDEQIDIIEAEQDEDGLWEIKARRQDGNGAIRFESIAPEDFFVDSSASGIRDCTVCGHASQGFVGDLVQMGFDFEEVIKLADDSVDEEEVIERQGGYDGNDALSSDPSMREVLITEVYMLMDIEGTGIPVRYKFICAGTKYTILDTERCSHRPFAVFEIDPEPHTFFGRSLADIIIDDQNTATALLRGLLDSVQMMNNPRIAVNDERVNMEDVLNNEIGGLIRVKGIPGEALQEFVSGTAAAAALPAIQHFDQVIRGKTGVSNVSMGLNADALSQHETKAGVDAAMQAEGATTELMARILAEGGMRQLFETIAQLAKANPQPDEMMRVNGNFVPVDPRSWTGKTDVIANVGLGTGRHQERIAALMDTWMTQQAIWQAYGPQNGLVTMTNMRNTRADLLQAGGIHNADRYFQPMTPEREQQLLQQAAEAAQAQQQGADPNMALVQVEGMKAQAKAQEGQQKLQLDAQKAMAEEQRKRAEAMADDDRERDRMAQELALKAAELLGKHQVQVNTQAIKAEQAAIRQPPVPSVRN